MGNWQAKEAQISVSLVQSLFRACRMGNLCHLNLELSVTVACYRQDGVNAIIEFHGCLLLSFEEGKEKTTPFGVNLMRSQVLYRAAQGYPLNRGWVK